MKTKLILATAMLAFAVPAAKAQVVLDMSLITCGQFLKGAGSRQGPDFVVDERLFHVVQEPASTSTCVMWSATTRSSGNIARST